MDALKITTKGNKVKRSPVGTVKALHLLAPNFFPLWDKEIAKIYDCDYAQKPVEKYIKFCSITQELLNKLDSNIFGNKNPLKCIDEYNYSKFTKKWI